MPWMTQAATLLPRGRPLPLAAWRARHRGLTAVLWAHAVALVGAAAVFENGAPLVTYGVALATAAAVGSAPRVGRRLRSTVVTAGLLASSAIVINLTGGQLEGRFHLFVVLAAIALYHEWFPFLLAIAFVAVHHTTMALLDPETLFDDPAALAQPLVWTGINVAAVAAASGVFLLQWRLSEQERDRTERVLDATADGIYGVDCDGRITFANPAMARFVGRTPDELVGREQHEALGHGAPDGTPYAPGDACRTCSAVAAADGTTVADDTFARADGSRFPVELSANPMADRGQRLGTVVTFRDLTERTRLTRHALHDALTGLPNRVLFVDHVRRALARLERRAESVAVLFIDLDRFKVINDSLGHGAGDALLVEAARRLQTVLRAHDAVARFGGDEFVVLCDDLTDSQQAVSIAERIVTVLSRPFALDGTEAYTSASVGIAFTSDPDARAEDLLRDADAAMYRAKTSGRNGYEVFDEDMRTRAVVRLELESQLRRALERDELRVHYQPQVNLADDRIAGVEALVRWQHPDRGLLPPADFLPLAEETGLIADVDAWVLEQACAQAKAWSDAHPTLHRLTMSVNISGRQLAQPGLARTVARVLTRTGLPPSRLCLEMTESVLMDDVGTASAALEALKRLGVQIAVDDFGTGYSSLAHLSRFPVDVLKVDRSFVAGLSDAAESWSMVAAVLSLSRALGLTTIAEGVEHEHQLGALRSLGCEVAQGYRFARPQPAEDIEEVLVHGLGRGPRSSVVVLPTSTAS